MIQVVTELGTRALAGALTESTQVEFTRCSIGKGEFDPSESSAREMEALVSQVAVVDVTMVRKEDDGVSVVADFDNTIIPGGTRISEMGVFARLVGGDEFLFAYAYTAEPEYVPPAEEDTYERRFVSHIVLSDDELPLVVTYSRFADAISSQLATAEEIYKHFGISTVVPPEEIASDNEVEGVLDGEAVDAGTFSVPASLIASDEEVKDYLNGSENE